MCDDKDHEKNLMTGARHYKLPDPSISNQDLAKQLGLQNQQKGYAGMPSYLFFSEGYVAGIRVADDHMVIPRLFRSVGTQLENMGATKFDPVAA